MATAYICPECVFNCDNLPDLEKHLQVHETNPNQSPVKQQQELPNKSVRNSPLYAKSQSIVNKSPVANNHSSPTKTYDRRYSCKLCPFSTHSVKAYFNHRQMAHGEQLTITECPFCDYASQYPGKVKKHLADEHPTQQMPLGQSPVQVNRTSNEPNNNIQDQTSALSIRFTDCPFCSFTSTDPETFRQHVLTNHLSDKNFRCLVCSRLYRHRGDCSFHIRKKHCDLMVGDNVDSLREYIGEFQPNTMSAEELIEILSHPPSGSISADGTSNSLNSSLSSMGIQQPNPPHAFRCGYCKFSSVNSGDVKKHQTWKHVNLLSNILPIDPNDPQQQPMVSYKRKRIHSTKTANGEDDGPVSQRPRLSMPAQRHLTIDTSSNIQNDQDSESKDLLSPNEPSSFDCPQLSIKNSNIQQQLSVLGSINSRVYKCVRCERLAPHRWIIERHIRSDHPSDFDNMSNIIIEIDKPSSTSNNGEPMRATKSSSSSSSSTEQSNTNATVPKAFSCSACSLQAYHLWVILRHIRNVHKNDGSNAKIIDNINNQIIEDTDDLESNGSSTKISTINNENNEETEQVDIKNEEMLKHLINTAMATRKGNSTPNNFLENLPANLLNNNVATSLANLLGQLTNKQLLQQPSPYQTEKAPLAKRYKCSLCPHVSAWGGNVKKHLKRMHPSDASGHVIDLGIDFASTQSPTISNRDEHDDEQIMNVCNEENYPSYQQSNELINTKLKDIDNSPSFAPQLSINNSQSTRPERLYGCSVCSYETTDPTNIHRHVELHSSDDGGGFQCSQCFFLSKWRNTIRKHMASTHGSNLASLTNVLEPLTVVKSNDATVIVKKWLMNENGMKREDNSNNNSFDTSIFYCSSCPYTNTNRSTFEQHVLHHEADKSEEDFYRCQFCTFITHENLLS